MSAFQVFTYVFSAGVISVMGASVCIAFMPWVKFKTIFPLWILLATMIFASVLKLWGV